MSVPGPGVRGTACGALPVGTREVLSARRVAVAPTRVPWRSARATDRTCPRASRRSGLHLRGPQGAEEGAGDPGAVEQPAHTYGHGFPGHDAGESACERGGCTPVLTSLPPPQLSAVTFHPSCLSLAHPAGVGTVCLLSAPCGLSCSLHPLFSLRKVALLSRSFCIQPHR